MEEKILCPFGEVLRHARKERGLTQYRLAKMVKRNPRYLSMLENNKREPRLSTVLMLARAMRMDAGELVRNVDALLPEDWAKPDEEDIQPKKAGRPKKKTTQKS
ncbi:MAG: helix-turn-helix transcriptional regulator [Desulfovibrio fairfieldensis]|nr:helix-turn-helix transcriptional regulator [Desulfovibrio fairfieldensis]